MLRALTSIIFVLFVFSTGTVAQTGSSTDSSQSSTQPSTQNQLPNTFPFPRIPQQQGVEITNSPGNQLQNLQNQQYLQYLQNLQNQPGNRQNVEASRPPAEPDTEFQEFVSNSLGYRLPIFGENLFQNVPSTFAPLDQVPVTPDYLLGPGDELLIRAWGQVSIDNYPALVDRTGAIYLPRVGNIQVAGVRYDQINDVLKNAVGRYFKNFELSASMGRLRSIQIFVVGQVRRPGTYTVSSLSTLVTALFASGGPSKRGSLRHIQLKRAGRVLSDFDLYDLLAKGDKSKDSSLQSGDVIYVPPAARLVALSGSVNVPAIFELKDHDTLEDALANAGGLTTTAAGQRVLLERIDARHIRRADEIPMSAEGMRQQLQDGDIVRFLHISPKFDNAVTIRGNVAVPGRYPWRDGMRVKDLIPSRDFLITDEFWKRQNLLSMNPNDQSAMFVQQPAPGTVQGSGGAAGNMTGAGNVNTGAGNIAQTLPGQTGSLGDETLAERVGKTEAQAIKQEELKNQVKRSAAEINWEYAVIQRMDLNDLTTHLLPFNLGKAIEGDGMQNLALQPGDIVTIFSQADMQVPIAQQTKFVRLEGEFRSAGVYQVQPGEKLRHVIERVGGFTPQAYLFGAELTRESVREDQQRRLDEYVGGLQRSLEQYSSLQRNLAGPDAATTQAQIEGQRRMLERMRQLRATGRIVLEVRPNAAELDSLPDLVLEDGDRLFVPFRPATVSVIGSVYNSNAFVFRAGKTVSDYLRLSGGVTRNGDKKRSFVIRANGSTISNQQHTGFIVNNFNNLRLMPGDTIVVPENLYKGAFIRGLRDWSQIFTQFALGAAAVQVLLP